MHADCSPFTGELGIVASNADADDGLSYGAEAGQTTWGFRWAPGLSGDGKNGGLLGQAGSLVAIEHHLVDSHSGAWMQMEKLLEQRELL